jgi:hypothetical protein
VGARWQWRYDELTGYTLLERKWALGFAAGSSGTLQWDWAREPDFGIKRSDGSAKIWQAMMRDMGQFAEKVAPSATSLILPQVAIVLPQSFQLSTGNALALEAQQKCVRALNQYARAEAYAVGEYQIELLGNPKLMIVPSPSALSQMAWQTLLDRVKSGATLLVSGRFDEDAHFHPTGRQTEVGLDYEPGPLTTRENVLDWPGGQAWLTYSGDKTTYLDRAFIPGGSTWAEKTMGKGKLLFTPLPLELNDNIRVIGDVYRYALRVADATSTYSTTVQDPGIVISPTRFPHATLYVITSESGGPSDVSFQDHSAKNESREDWTLAVPRWFWSRRMATYRPGMVGINEAFRPLAASTVRSYAGALEARTEPHGNRKHAESNPRDRGTAFEQPSRAGGGDHAVFHVGLRHRLERCAGASPEVYL